MSASTPTPPTSDRTYNLPPLPPASPTLDAGLAREKARIDAAADADSVSTSTVDPLTTQLLPRGVAYVSYAGHLLGEAMQEATSGAGIAKVKVIDATIDRQQAEVDREVTVDEAQARLQKAADQLEDVKRRHDATQRLVEGSEPDRDGIVWTNGRVETLRAEVTKSMAHARGGLGDARHAVQSFIRRHRVLLLLVVLEFGLSLSMWFTLLNVVPGDPIGVFGLVALTTLTALTLTLVPHALVKPIAEARLKRRFAWSALVLAVPIFVAVAVSVARQQFYLGKAQEQIDAASAQVPADQGAGGALTGAGDAGEAAVDLASAQSLLELYGSWWMVPLFAVLLMVGIAWVLFVEVPRYNSHEKDYCAVYEQLVRAESELAAATHALHEVERATRTALIEADGAVQRAQVAELTHREQWTHFIETTIPALPSMQYDEYLAEMTRLKADPTFTAAVSMHLADVRAARAEEEN